MSRDGLAIRSFSASRLQAYKATINPPWLYSYCSLRTLASDMNPAMLAVLSIISSTPSIYSVKLPLFISGFEKQ
jgi:hypothetical protein